MTDAAGLAETDDGVSFTSAERTKAFTDAVVAIAMTLLILPLLETISDAGDAHATTAEWVQENSGSLIAFVLSFAIIANLWTSHHRLFARVEKVSRGLLWITIAWMLTIVWLPVATAMTGQMQPDPLQYVLYIGTMIVSSLLLLVARLYLRAHPALHDIPRDRLAAGVVADLVTAMLFLAALAVAILVPDVGYAALFLMFLIWPLRRLATAVVVRRAHTR